MILCTEQPAAAVFDTDLAILQAGQASGVFRFGVDRSVNMKVFDDAAVFDITEGRSVFIVGGVVEGQRVSVAVKGAGEVVRVAARRFIYGDVVAELDVLFVEYFLVIMPENIAEFTPFILSGRC